MTVANEATTVQPTIDLGLSAMLDLQAEIEAAAQIVLQPDQAQAARVVKLDRLNDLVGPLVESSWPVTEASYRAPANPAGVPMTRYDFGPENMVVVKMPAGWRPCWD